MSRHNPGRSTSLRTLSGFLALALIVTACGISDAETDARRDALREEPVLMTPPPDATVIGEFGRGPISAGFGSIRSGARVMTLWATTASVEELETWYVEGFGSTYEFTSLIVRGGIDLTDSRSPDDNSIRVDIRFPELIMLPEFGGETFDQDTHPGMTFVLAKAGERDDLRDGG